MFCVWQEKGNEEDVKELASERKENKGASMDDTRKMLVMPKFLDTGSHGQEKKKIRCACRMHTLAASVKMFADYYLLRTKCNMISVRNPPALTRFPSCSARLARLISAPLGCCHLVL